MDVNFNAKQALVLDEGQIIERGTHEEPMVAGGFYHDLYMSQFRCEAALTSDDDKTPAEVKGIYPAGGRGAPDLSGYRVSFLAFYSDLPVWFWR